jgi:hypothetical protein
MVLPWPGRRVAHPRRASRHRPQLEPLEDRVALTAFILNNGPGEASTIVGVDGYGSFGSDVGGDTTKVTYHPVGAQAPGSTTFDSGVAIGFASPEAGPNVSWVFLTSGDIGGSGGLSNPAVTGTATSATSQFSFGPLSFTLTQTLTPTFAGSTQIGSVLTQTYTITNPTDELIDFALVRYFDGDLLFASQLRDDDGGGRLVLGGREILFETDTATGTSESTTFVGISAEGGAVPSAGRFEVAPFSGLRSRILNGAALTDRVAGDGLDGDQFIDAGSGFNVTLALRNEFALAAGETAVYVTRTFFGTAVPDPVPPDDPPPPTDPDPPPPPVDEEPPPVDNDPPPVDNAPPPVVETPPVAVAPTAETAPRAPLPVVGPAVGNRQLAIALVQTQAERQPQTGIVLPLVPRGELPVSPVDSARFAAPRFFVEGLFNTVLTGANILDGVITGRVFEDDNGNGVKDAGEVGLAGQTVYLDTNGDGLYQPGEPATLTDRNGEYVFVRLRLDSYVVRQVIWERLEQTFPVIAPAATNGAGGGHPVTLTAGTPVAVEKNFGAVQLSGNRPRRPVARTPAEEKSSPAPAVPSAPPDTPQPPGPEEEGEALDLFFGQLENGDGACLMESDDAGDETPDEPSEAVGWWKPLLVSAVALLYWLRTADGPGRPGSGRLPID